MNSSRALRLLLLLALPLAVYSNGSAASLQGKVTEIQDGENFTMISQTHVIKVRLVAMAAPASNQSYSEVAKQHLSDLILNKIVSVRYTGMQQGLLEGQVHCGEMDVNGQMIRDGVAWYNQAEAMNLSETERSIYQASQDAAQSERRGLWQDASPVSPWDFRKAQALAKTPRVTAAPASSSPSLESLSLRKAKPELSSETLVTGLIRYSARAGKPEVKPLSANPASSRWLKYQPTDHHFSILFPSTGRQMTLPVQDLHGKEFQVNYLIGADDTSLYFLLWTKGPNGTATDDSTTTETINAFVDGVNGGARQSGGLWVEVTPGRKLTVSEYTGRQYGLTAGPANGTVRILSKQIGSDREVFILCVLNGPQAESDGASFFSSFKIGNSKEQTANNN